MDLSTKAKLQKAFEVFLKTYDNRVKITNVDTIIGGEQLELNENNILVNNTTFEDPKFEDKCKLCTKKLYEYQKNAIKKIRELELKESYKNNKDDIVSNGWLLHLPIGSGKTLVFTFIALMYRTVPIKPIVVSTSGINIPEDNLMQLKYYPFYYENVGYIKGKENAVITLKNYEQYKITVIITHQHLMNQLEDYIKTDFHPQLLKYTKITYALRPNDITLDTNILVVPARTDIINKLVDMSYVHPFMRVIVDDYTNMDGIEHYRQIRASSTLFISGSGFERDKDKIPPSYYTLRHIDVDKYSLVAPIEETKEGIRRDNILTVDLIGAQTDFSMYKFINDLDEFCIAKYNSSPYDFYKPIQKSASLLNYLSLNFILKNIDRFNNSIRMIEEDLNNKKLEEKQIVYYKKWKESIDQEGELFKILFINRDSKYSAVQPMIMNKCGVCGSLPEVHNGWGFISTCCGTFYCVDCAKAMTTRRLVMKDTVNNKQFEFTDSKYYCTICHKSEPTFVLNCSRHKNMDNIQGYNIITQFMDVDNDKSLLKINYYFKMFLEGLKPKYHEGKVIECELKNNYDKSKLQTKNNYELINQLFTKDRLAMSSIVCIDQSLKELNIKPSEMNTTIPNILIYGCPNYMHKRVSQYFNAFTQNPKYNIYKVNIIFKNSLNELIGLHQNIMGIVVWENPSHTDEIQQLIGRIIRVNNWNNPICFYITCKS